MTRFVPSLLSRFTCADHLSGPRLTDEIECAASVLLAIALGHLAGVENVSWAAFSGYMVMRGHLADSFWRGFLRITGTLAGAGLSLLIVPGVVSSLWLAMLASALAGGIALYGALTRKHAYAWLFFGFTFEMVLLDKLHAPGHSIAVFVTSRVLEVMAGTVACVLVSALSGITARRRWPGTRAAARQSLGWHPHALRHAGQAACALALLPFLGAVSDANQLGQSAVSIIAVMLVPVSSLGISGFLPVSRRLLHRVTGCLGGAVMAAGILLLAHGSVAGLLCGTVLGVVLGRHIENGSHGHAYIGTQFTLAILVTLVPDSYAGAAAAPGFDRLWGILTGMIILEPLLVLWHLIGLARGGEVGRATGGSEAGD